MINEQLTTSGQRNERLCVLANLVLIDVGALLVLDGQPDQQQLEEVQRRHRRDVPLQAAEHAQFPVLCEIEIGDRGFSRAGYIQIEPTRTEQHI